jgi:hypothetical protein
MIEPYEPTHPGAILKDEIDKHRNLFWYTPEKEPSEISDSLLVKNILN